MAEKKVLTGDPRIDSKWFSRRHETNENHTAASEKRQLNKSDEAKREQADDRLVTRGMRTPQGQMDELDRRLGKDVGAVRERARLRRQGAK